MTNNQFRNALLHLFGRIIAILQKSVSMFDSWKKMSFLDNCMCTCFFFSKYKIETDDSGLYYWDASKLSFLKKEMVLKILYLLIIRHRSDFMQFPLPYDYFCEDIINVQNKISSSQLIKLLFSNILLNCSRKPWPTNSKAHSILKHKPGMYNVRGGDWGLLKCFSLV